MTSGELKVPYDFHAMLGEKILSMDDGVEGRDN